jgi:hypothetical protein
VTLNHQQDQVKKTRTWSRYLGLGVAQGSVGPVHEPTVQNGCEGLQQLQEAYVDSSSSRVMGERDYQFSCN